MTADPIVRVGDEPIPLKIHQNSRCEVDWATAMPIDEMNKIGIPTKYVYWSSAICKMPLI